MRVASIAIVTLCASIAQAVPMQLSHQGRLLDSGGEPLSGSHTLSFVLHDAETGGNVVWSEELTVDFASGYYSVVLGADGSNPLTENDLDQTALFLELVVDGGDPLLPRQRITSAPYAIMAGTAQNVVGGTVDATSVSIGGTQIVDGSGNWVGPSGQDTLAGLSCNGGDVASYDGTNWICVAGSTLGTDTQLSEGQVEGYVTNGALNLAAGTQIDGQDVSTGAHTVDTNCSQAGECSELALGPASYDVLSPTAQAGGATGPLYWGDAVLSTGGHTTSLDWSTLTGVPSDIADGDQNTQLTEAQVEGYISDDGYALAAQLNDGNASTTPVGWADLTSVPADIADGDQNTQLTEAQVEGYVTNGAIDLAAGTTIGGEAVTAAAIQSAIDEAGCLSRTGTWNGSSCDEPIAIVANSQNIANPDAVTTCSTRTDGYTQLATASELMNWYNALPSKPITGWVWAIGAGQKFMQPQYDSVLNCASFGANRFPLCRAAEEQRRGPPGFRDARLNGQSQMSCMCYAADSSRLIACARP